MLAAYVHSLGGGEDDAAKSADAAAVRPTARSSQWPQPALIAPERNSACFDEAPQAASFPRRSTGRFRRLKWAVMAVTLAIYYVTPWLRWDRGPYAPDQAVLVDLANRRFYMFAIEIWPHEFYYVAGLLIMAGIGLFLVTSAVGRAWCGYACPQTVWTDLFLHVERCIDGDRNAQIRLAAAPWSAGQDRAGGLLKARDLAGHRVADRRRVDLLLRRRADAGARLRATAQAPFVAYAHRRAC